MIGEITLEELISVNPAIDLADIDLLSALYCGGIKFEKYKEQFLILREAEKSGASSVQQRLKRAQYINRSAGLVNWIVAVATKNNPRIEGESEHWETLNKDADGMGTPFSSLVRQLVADMLVSRFPYVEAVSEGDNEPYTIYRRDPETVYDFENDDNGDLVWLKTAVEVWSRSSTFAAPDRKKVIITYYTDEDTVSYVLYKKGNSYQAEDGSAISMKALISPDPSMSVFGHDFGAVPVFRGNATKTHWLMDRIREPLKAIYNSEVDLSYSLSQCAYAQLIFILDNADRANSIVRSEAGAWVLQGNEKAEYLSPPNDAFDGIFKNIERLITSLNQSLQMMGIETSQIAQAGRMSGDAVREHKEPQEALVDSLVWPVGDMLNKCLIKIGEAMGLSDIPKVVGLGWDVTEDDMEELKGVIGNGRVEGGTEDGTEEEGPNDEA